MTNILPQINIAKKHHESLRKEFPNVSRQTIYDSLKYRNNSDLAKAIRTSAIKLLKQELSKIEENTKAFDNR